MGWGDPSWNWGYAVGEAHDRAAELRPRLRTVGERESWLRSVIALDSIVPLDEAKLCFGLRVQRCSFAAGPMNDVLDLMVKGEFEGAEGDGSSRLRDAIAPHLSEDFDPNRITLELLGGSAAPPMPGTSDGPGDTPAALDFEARVALVAALMDLGFVSGGV